ncbi:MAG: hypothetical protein V3V05_04345 [Pontiella sp.]
MYTTIEADIENGQIIGPEVAKLPSHAHVLITLLDSFDKKRPEFGTCTSEKIKISKGALAPLSGKDLTDWGL